MYKRQVLVEPNEWPDKRNETICLKGISEIQHTYSKERLQVPLKRVGERGAGEFVEITWDEALDTIAEKVKAVSYTHLSPVGHALVAGAVRAVVAVVRGGARAGRGPAHRCGIRVRHGARPAGRRRCRRHRAGGGGAGRVRRHGAREMCIRDRLCPGRARTWGDLDDPSSEVAKLVREREHMQLLPERGPKPSVYYLL